MQQRLELFLARLLSAGTWLACAVFAFGTALALSGWSTIGYQINAVGIGLMIALPVARLISMMVVFVRIGDRLFAAICALVLLIIAAGIAIGIESS